MTVSRSSGSFGTHGDYNASNYTWNGHNYLNALMWDVEDGTIEKRGVDYTNDTTATFENQWSISTTVKPVNLTRSARRVYDTDERGALEFRGLNHASTTQLYTSAKFQLGADRQSGKFIRAYLLNSKDVFFSTGCDNRQLRAGFDDSGSATTEFNSPDTFGAGTWHQVEILIEQSGGTVTTTTWIDGAEQWSNDTGLTGTALPTNRDLDIGHMVDEPGAGRCAAQPTWDSDEYWADWYADVTQARFVISSSSSFATRGKTEIQIPRSGEWSTTSVGAGINQGEFASLSGKYLYFVDTSGSGTLIGQFN
jgi:hypothetical protein